VRTRNARGPHSIRHKFSVTETIRVIWPQPAGLGAGRFVSAGLTGAAACPALALAALALAALALAALALAALAAFAALAARAALTAFACVTNVLCRIGSYKEVLGELATVWHPASTTPVNIRAPAGVSHAKSSLAGCDSRTFSCFPISCAAPCEYTEIYLDRNRYGTLNHVS